MLDYVEAFHNLCPSLFFSFRDFLLTLFLFPLGFFFFFNVIFGHRVRELRNLLLRLEHI